MGKVNKLSQYWRDWMHNTLWLGQNGFQCKAVGKFYHSPEWGIAIHPYEKCT